MGMSKEQLINIILKQEFIKESSNDKNESSKKRSFLSMNESSDNKSNDLPPLKKQKICPIQERINKKCKKRKKKDRDFNMNKYNQRHIALKIAYFGTNYQGFVRQKNCENTIEEQLFCALIRTCLIEDIDSCGYS